MRYCARLESTWRPSTTHATYSSAVTPPETDDHLLEDLRVKMRETGAAVGIATDGDADRFGIVDEDGTFVQPNYIIALLFDYLVETRGWKNGVGKSVATTNLINALAEKYKVELHETPVGFKDIGELITHWWRRKRPSFYPQTCSRERWSASRSALLRDGGASRGVSRQTARRLTC